MFKRSVSKNKPRILFVDERNDLQSQIAEYFVNQFYGTLYDAYSAGPTSDCIDCELISVMYQLDYDIRTYTSMDFNHEDLPKSYDYIIFLEKSTYDRVKDSMPWDAPMGLVDFGRKENFEDATDDLELFECYKRLIEKVRDWVSETFDDVSKVKALVA